MKETAKTKVSPPELPDSQKTLIYQWVMETGVDILTDTELTVLIRFIKKVFTICSFSIKLPFQQMSKDFGVAINTVRSGMSGLEEKGILTKSAGASRRESQTYTLALPFLTPYENRVVTLNVPDINLKEILRAVLFASGKALDFNRLSEITGALPPDIRKAMSQLQNESQPQSCTIFENAEGFFYGTRKEFKDYVLKLKRPPRTRLTDTELEVLAIVMYKSPASHKLVNEIRGKESGRILTALHRRLLLQIVRYSDSGLPVYAPTEKCLGHFGLRSLLELPPLETVTKPPLPSPIVTGSNS